MLKPSLLLKGPIFTKSGYGVHCRQVYDALVKSGLFEVDVIPIKWGETPHDYDEKFSEEIFRRFQSHVKKKSAGFQYDIGVQVTIPNEFEKLGRFNVGITAGIEVDYPSPQWILKCNEMDLIIVPSQFSKDGIEKVVFQGSDGSVLKLQKPIVVCHEGVNTKIFSESNFISKYFEFKAPFNFLHVGLGLNKPMGEDRKNISHLVKWFCEKFKGNREVGLVLKVSVMNNTLLDYTMVQAKIREIKTATGCGEYPTIELIHGDLTDQELASLYLNRQIKAFVSLTHGEGFGLPLLEAASCRLPVIATDWSGHLDFLTVDKKKLFVPISYDLSPVPASAIWKGVIEEGSKWANPSEEDFKNKAAKIVKSYDKPAQWATELAEHVHKNFSVEVTGRRLVDTILGAYRSAQNLLSSSGGDPVRALRSRFPEGKKRLLYTMPMSAGDVYISTAVVDSLKKKFPDHDVYFATQKQYAGILDGNPDIHAVIDWEPWMQDVPLMERVFDEVYTPNLSVQMVFSNWVHGGKGRKLAEEMANQCLVQLGECKISLVDPKIELPQKYVVIHVGSGKGQWEARNYRKWQEVVENVYRLGGIDVVQVGLPDEPELKGCIDLRGKTRSYNELAFVISRAKAFVGIDSVSMHLAGGLGVPLVSIFGSSYGSSTGPANTKSLNVLLDTPDRHGCDKACYKTQCIVDRDFPCINEISPRTITEKVLFVLGETAGGKILPDGSFRLEGGYTEVRPKISGYTHVFNAKSHGYPYIESIVSMLGFCDEVVVVDGGSTDGTTQELVELADLWKHDRLQVVTREWDWNEPGMDGMQKAFGRAMCTGDFLWQQDADEVVHEQDYQKIRRLVDRFPTDVNLIHLPVIELWGDERTVRTDRHSWKWRLSRNDFSITHGIAQHARVFDENTGKTFAKKGMSDGCEYIDVMTGEYIKHKGFYNEKLEFLRKNDPIEYGRTMNEIFEQLPCVYHYSWCDLPRKIKNFKTFWNKCWSNLYNDPSPEDRFPSVNGEDPESIRREADRLRNQGGEHRQSPVFRLHRTNPSLMKEWIESCRK